jgi:GxxExxY protein
MTENEIANKVIGLSIEVHTALGPGLLESAYQECLYYCINQSGLNVEREKPMPLIFQEVQLDCAYRMEKCRGVTSCPFGSDINLHETWEL